MTSSITLAAYGRGLQPEPDLSVAAWADRYRVLSSKSSSEPGPWRTSRAPYLREPMEKLSPQDQAQVVVMMFASQTGKTEVGLNWLGFAIHHAPGPMLAVQPTLDMAKRLNRQRLDALVSETAPLMERIAPARSRDSGNTMFSKDYPGGILALTGANSASALSAMPVRYLFGDEVDRWPMDVDGEGDPLALALKRTTTFGRRKVLITSTPTVKGESRVEAEFLKTDQRRFYVPCPHCGGEQVLEWRRLKWAKGEPEGARYQCCHCEQLIAEEHKTTMLDAGTWRPTGPDRWGGLRVGYHLNGLYSPLGWLSWQELALEWEDSQNDPPTLKTFVNTRLAETWEERAAVKVTADALLERVQPFTDQTVPVEVVILTAGVDVQDNRLAVSLWGWGDGERSWLVAHTEIWGSPVEQEVWDQLNKFLHQGATRIDGAKLPVTAVAIDSGGHATHEVYGYVRDRRRVHRGTLAIKGSSTRGAPALGKGRRQDVNWRGRTIRQGVELFMLGTDTIKDTFYGRLLRDDGGPGSVYLGVAATPEVLEQLTSERRVTRYNRAGMPRSEYVLRAGTRNEALDCAVYAYAALLWELRRHDRRTVWEQFAKRLNGAPEQPDDKPEQEEIEAPQAPIRRPQPSVRPRRGRFRAREW